MKYCFLFIILLSLSACKQNSKSEKPVAQVFESTLDEKEVLKFIPQGTSSEDSLIMAQSYIKNWITRKLLLHKAIENLSGQEQEIQKQVEDYRTSLLIHYYKQELIMQRLQDNIKEEDVASYYEDNKNNFILSTPIVKAVFFILPKNAPHFKDVRKMFVSDKPQDEENLEEYCLTNAKIYDNFNNSWVEVKYLLNLIPGDFNTLEKEIMVKKNIEKEDDDNYYFLKIKEMNKEQTIAPLEYVREEIVLILKNKKKLQFESDLEKQINQEGIQKNYVKIY